MVNVKLLNLICLDWRIGTSPESEDVLPEMDVGFAGGSEALIENASLILNGQSVGHVTDLIARVKVCELNR